MNLDIGPFEAASIVIVAAAALGYVNHRFVRLPQTIGLTITGALAAAAVALFDASLPGSHLSAAIRSFLGHIDFRHSLLNGMLSFLLFAGALHVDLAYVRMGRGPITLLSTIGVIISTGIIGGSLWLIAKLVHVDAPLRWCLVFGALISPTDPIATMALLSTSSASGTLRATVAGESLFNDGVGVVVFGIALAAAAGGAIEPAQAAWLFLKEAGGGAVLGLAAGWVAFLAMKSIEDGVLEIMITLALVMGGYTLAQHLGVSGPVAMAVAGLLVGNKGATEAMGEEVRAHLFQFWDVIDQVLNAVLFLLIGLQGIALLGDWRLAAIGLVALPVSLLARLLSIAGPLMAWRNLLPSRQAFPLLTWGGLRGGLSVAMALSVPAGPWRDPILAATYVIVMFSVIVQGATVEALIRRTIPAAPREA